MKVESFAGRLPPYRALVGVLLLQAVMVSISHARLFTFTPPGKDKPTFLLDTEFRINIKAFESHMVVAAWIGSSWDHEDIEVYGFSGIRSTMELRFPKEGITWGISFEEKTVQDITVDRYVKFIPEKIFPPFDKLTYPLLFDDAGKKDYHSALKSFQCDRGIKRVYKPNAPLSGTVTFEIDVEVSNFRVQAYHVNDGKFSPADHCPEDRTTTTPTTTDSHILTFTTTPPSHPHPAKTTTPHFLPIPSGSPKHKYVVNQKVDNRTIQCISMEGRVSFEIAYYVYDGMYRTTRKMVKVGIPDDVRIEGVCEVDDAGFQKLTMKFAYNWAVEFVFGLNVGYSVLAEEGNYQSKLDYSIHAVSLKYSIDDSLTFPKAFTAEGSNFTISFTERDNLPRKKAASNFFVCNAPKKFHMSEDVTLFLSEFKFKAFIQDGDTNFYGIPSHCEADMKQIGASTLVVVAGCLVITFSLVFFIALLALISVKCRTKRKRSKYQSL